jgi:aquaporin TIP
MSGNIAFGRFDDSFSAASIKAYVAEFISTLVFVFAGVGSAIAYSKSSLSVHAVVVDAPTRMYTL